MTLFHLTSLHFTIPQSVSGYYIWLFLIFISVHENLAKIKLCQSQSDKNWIDLCLSIIYAESVLFIYASVSLRWYFSISSNVLFFLCASLTHLWIHAGSTVDLKNIKGTLDLVSVAFLRSWTWHGIKRKTGKEKFRKVEKYSNRREG